MPAGDPASVLHSCIKLVGRWTPGELSASDEVLRDALLQQRVIPVTTSFCNANTKDAKLFADLRAGQVLFVDFLAAGDPRGYARQNAVIALCSDYAGFVCAKGFTSAEAVRLIQSGDLDSMVDGELAARRECMIEGLGQEPVDLPQGHRVIFAAAQEWIHLHEDRLTASTRNGSLYGCGIAAERVSFSGWFEHGEGARHGVQRPITAFMAKSRRSRRRW